MKLGWVMLYLNLVLIDKSLQITIVLIPIKSQLGVMIMYIVFNVFGIWIRPKISLPFLSVPVR